MCRPVTLRETIVGNGPECCCSCELSQNADLSSDSLTRQAWRGRGRGRALCIVQVTFLGVSKKFTICQEAKQVNTKQNLHFECLEPHHFVPEIVETYPYEQLSHAVLNWVEENADRCDVIHGHEWGGAFVDLITANNHRQVRGLRHASLLVCRARIMADKAADLHEVTCGHVQRETPHA